eukprot:4879259-Heterocapsa_arctica.AAC.1
MQQVSAPPAQGNGPAHAEPRPNERAQRAAPDNRDHRRVAQPFARCATPGCRCTFLAIPDPEDGYIHTRCCSKCKSSAGLSHSRRCGAQHQAIMNGHGMLHLPARAGRIFWQRPTGWWSAEDWENWRAAGCPE